MSGAPKRSSMAFFSDASNHYSHRVRIVLAEKGIAADILHVDPRHLPDEAREASPYGTLPVLVDRDLALFESSVIMEYLDERFPHPPLLPVYPVARAEVRQFISRLERDWCPLLEQLVESKNRDATDKSALALRDSLVTIAPVFGDRPFFLSDEFTLADCCLAALLWRLEKVGVILPKTRQTQALHDYMERIFARNGFRASLTDAERDMRPGYYLKNGAELCR